MPLRLPQQKRSRKTLARIVDAGIAILREQGPEGLTVQDVVARARTSVGSFYQRFSGKEELLRHLEDALAAEERARFDDALAARVSPGLKLAAKVGVVVGLLTAEPSRAPGPDASREEAIVEELLKNRGEIRHPDPEAAIRIGYAAVAGALRAPPLGLGESKAAVFTFPAELTRLWLAYLGPKDGGGGAVDFFEVWG